MLLGIDYWGGKLGVPVESDRKGQENVEPVVLYVGVQWGFSFLFFCGIVLLSRAMIAEHKMNL